ncbi:type I secretion system permease/ATPase [Musicola keenii]|uniref:type I secretion system permease/ATPase n=1 Tax=Musicola keenii TaxID=2884250 RepID=UPI00177D5188|nr:type I secretion system permease/ATPase [Musicola keenii]
MNAFHGQPPDDTENPVSRHYQDFRSRHDDPLLDSLLVLCRLQGKASSRTALTAGLPLKEQRLTINLLPTAAARAGLQARILKRSLSAIPRMSLPAMLMLREGRAAILLGWNDDGSARIMPSETEGGEITLDHNTLQQNYLGLVLFAQPRHRFEQHVSPLLSRTYSCVSEILNLSRFFYLDAAIASLLISAIALSLPLFVMHIYDHVIPRQTTETLWMLASGIIIAQLFELLLRALQHLCLNKAAKRIDVTASATLFERLLGMQTAARQQASPLIHNMLALQGLRHFLTPQNLSALLDIPFTVLALIVMGFIGGPLVWVPLLTCLGLSAAYWLLQLPLSNAIRKSQPLLSEQTSLLIETLYGLDTIKINNAESERQYQWEQNVGLLSRLRARINSLAAFSSSLTHWGTQFAGLIIVVLGVYRIMGDTLSPGALIACYMLNSRILAPLNTLASRLSRTLHARLAVDAVHQILQSPQERHEAQRPLTRENIRGSIEFRDVTFQYPEQKKCTLTDLNLSIRPGEKVGIIGRTGSGKSTLEKLLLGLYSPSHGNLLIDGMDARQLDVGDLRHNIGYVPQDIQLFNGTLRENLLCGARYIEDEAMLKAADIAGINEFARLHPDGYNLQVGERGLQLSGGQRQAVAIARALLLEPPILVMDEPTSAMDNSSEDRFRQALMPFLEDKTLILVTHRVSMLALVDRLIILDKGRVIADGPKTIVMDALKKGQINTSR